MSIFENHHQEDPLHSGEIYHLWSYLSDTKMNCVILQVFINHTGDKDLKSFLEELLESCLIEEEQQVEGILKELGIRLPPAPPDRPNVELQDIPAGARLNDSEIAILIKNELTCGKMLCSYIAGIAIQEYIGSMFNEFHSDKSIYEQKLLTLIKQKGWIISPPIHVK